MSDFGRLVEGFAAGADEGSADRLLEHATSRELSDDEIAGLSRALASDSGALASHVEGAADVASTGGPSSLSTLLAPLYLRHLNVPVIKIGVPGRPAGGIDVMAQIPSFQTSLPHAEAQRCVDACGYVHLAAGRDFAPLDALLFTRRQTVGAQAVPSLVVASLLSKKLAAGIERVGIDIRVSPLGNLGHDWASARRNAEKMVRVGKILGIRVSCFLTDGSFPYQPYIGRGEALLALDDIFSGEASPELSEHARRCYSMACSIAGSPATTTPSGPSILEHFSANLEGQGTDMGRFRNAVERLRSSPGFSIESTQSGHVGVDLAALRSGITAAQRSLISSSLPFPDPCGVVLRSAAGEFVERGRELAVLRMSGHVSEDAEQTIRASIRAFPRGLEAPGYEEVGSG